MDYLKELEGKRIHDHVYSIKFMDDSARRVMVAGPLIVGAGPSGMAAAACLKERGISSIILERANCIGSLWQHKTYDRLRLHLPKHFCDLPRLPFPANFPTYPTRQQFVDYLNAYSDHFDIKPMFNIRVVSAEFDRRCGYWRVRAVRMKMEEIEYNTKWPIVATGENAEEVTPEIEGIDEFEGPVLHTSSYRRGEIFRQKKVLVIGCGNSGMEICLDLCNYDACPSLVVRNTVHILPQEMFGRSTFGWSVSLLRWLPLRFVDRLLLLASRLMLGDTSRYGLHRPHLGPLELKNIAGKTPVLDVGTLAEIKSGNIKVCKEVKRVTSHGAEFVDEKIENFDAIILATGYKSNVPTWLKEMDMFSEKDGLPRKPFPNGWKGDNGLYAIGFAKRGLVGASSDAEKISQDIDLHFHACSTKSSFILLTRACSSHFLPNSVLATQSFLLLRETLQHTLCTDLSV